MRRWSLDKTSRDHLGIAQVDKKAADAERAEADARAALAGVIGDAAAAATPVVATSAVAKLGRDALWRRLRGAVLGDAS